MAKRITSTRQRCYCVAIKNVVTDDNVISHGIIGYARVTPAFIFAALHRYKLVVLHDKVILPLNDIDNLCSSSPFEFIITDSVLLHIKQIEREESRVTTLLLNTLSKIFNHYE